jgi:hypothetical protein
MKKRLLTLILLTGISVILFSFEIPTGWVIAGDKPKSYDMGIDKGAGQDGKNAATIKSIKNKIDGFGTLMQTCLPDKYYGKRIRMSGFLKANNVTDWASFWLRIDQKGSSETLGFDNMHDGKKNRSITGTTDWKKYEIVLDVPLNASDLAYGALLSGTGQIWFDNLNFEVVDSSVPLTGLEKASLMPNDAPENLDFEK